MKHEGIKDGALVVHVSIVQTTFENMIKEGLLSQDQYDIKDINIKKEEYPDDVQWLALKKASTKAFKLLKEYEFTCRNYNEDTEGSPV